MAKKIVLGFSGGLDTSFCVKYLTDEKEYEAMGKRMAEKGYVPPSPKGQ